jgi:MFS family permease
MPDPKTSRNIVLLGIVSLLNDISSEIIQPILPLFIASLGGGALAVGLIGGISDGIPSLLQVFAGFWSDRNRRRKPLVMGGYALSALGKLLLSLSLSWQQVFVLRVLERSGKGIRSAPRDAMISESADTSNRGRGFGLHRAMDSSGAVIGSLAAYLLWKGGLDFSHIFLSAGLLALVALIPFIKVRETHPWRQEDANPAAARADASPSLNLSSLSPELRRFMAIASLFALGNISYMFFILRAQQLFTGTMAIAAPLLLYVLFNFVYAALSIPMGIWSDRIGRKKILTIGYALFSVTAFGFSAISSLEGMIILFGLYGLVYAIVDASQSAFVSDLSRSNIRGTSLGLYYSVVGIAAIVSGLVAGELWSRLGSGPVFLFGSAASILAALALWRMKLRDTVPGAVES